MNIIATALLALSMSADAFAVALGKGAALRQPRPAEAVRTGVVFGCIEAIAPILGWACGSLASSFVTAVDHWIAFSILSALGVKMIHASTQQNEAHDMPSQHNLCALVIAGFGSSVDSMGIGVTLAFVEANIWITAAAIGLATFVMATIGIMAGHIIGRRVGNIAASLAGAVLIAIGTKILLEHTGCI